MRRARSLGRARDVSAPRVSVSLAWVLVSCLFVVVTNASAQQTAEQPAATTVAPPAGTPEPPPATEPPPPTAAEAPAAPETTPDVTEPSSYPTPAAPPPVPAAAEEAEAEADPLGGGVKFKAGKGVDIKSNDGNFSLNLRFKGQIQDELQLPSAEGSNNRNHLYIRRMRLAAAGAVFSKTIKYKIELSFAGGELSRQPVAVSGATPAQAMGTVTSSREVLQQAPLLDLYLDFTAIRDLQLRVGQAKVTYGRERILGDSDLQTVDRSIDDVEFNYDRDVGVELRSTDLGGIDKFRYFLGLYAAEDRNSSLNTIGTGDFGFLYFARLETLPFGSFEETPVDFARTSPKLSFGLAYALVQSDVHSAYANQGGAVAQSPVPQAIVDYTSHNFTADFLFKAAGFSALGAFHYRKVAGLPEDVFGRDGIGVVIQAHYLFAKEAPFALAGNYSTVRKVGDDSAIDERSEAGGGIGYYFNDHALKLEAEFEHIWGVGEGEAERKPDNRLRLQLSFII
jgi:phosphate-selective porin OprO/OprP